MFNIRRLLRDEDNEFHCTVCGVEFDKTSDKLGYCWHHPTDENRRRWLLKRTTYCGCKIPQSFGVARRYRLYGKTWCQYCDNLIPSEKEGTMQTECSCVILPNARHNYYSQNGKMFCAGCELETPKKNRLTMNKRIVRLERVFRQGDPEKDESAQSVIGKMCIPEMFILTPAVSSVLLVTDDTIYETDISCIRFEKSGKPEVYEAIAKAQKSFILEILSNIKRFQESLEKGEIK